MFWFNHLTLPWNIRKNAQFLTPSYMDQDIINDKLGPVIFIPLNELPLCFTLVFIRQWLQPNIKKKWLKQIWPWVILSISIDSLAILNLMNNCLTCGDHYLKHWFNLSIEPHDVLDATQHWIIPNYGACYLVSLWKNINNPLIGYSHINIDTQSTLWNGHWEKYSM